MKQLLEDLNFEPASLIHFSCAADSTKMGSVDIQAEIQKIGLEAKICCSQKIRLFACPVGNPQARIGIVLCSVRNHQTDRARSTTVTKSEAD